MKGHDRYANRRLRNHEAQDTLAMAADLWRLGGDTSSMAKVAALPESWFYNRIEMIRALARCST